MLFTVLFALHRSLWDQFPIPFVGKNPNPRNLELQNHKPLSLYATRFLHDGGVQQIVPHFVTNYHSPLLTLKQVYEGQKLHLSGILVS